MSNTRLSELDRLSKRDLKEMALKHKLEFKSNLGLSDEIKFGIEIEALGKSFLYHMKRNNSVLFYPDPRSEPNNVYELNKWIVNKENSLRTDDNKRIYSSMTTNYEFMRYDGILDEDFFNNTLSNGGEVVSPILTDDNMCWTGLKKILDYMKNNIPDLHINSTCSTHNHFDIGILNNDPEKLYSFMVLLAETESVLTRFFCGDFINLRDVANRWAKPFNNFFYCKYSKHIDLSSFKKLLSILYLACESAQKAHSFDFYNLYSCFDIRSKTFENRLPNGTLSPEIMQNNIMLMGFLLEYIAFNDYDYEKGFRNILCNNISAEINDDLAFYVADFLPNDDLKLDFLCQYYKDEKTTNSKRLVKSTKKLY